MSGAAGAAGAGSAEVGVVIIHGMGDPAPSFAAPLIDGLSHLFGDDAGAIAFEPCFWSDILQDSENEVWRRLQGSGTPMQLGVLRKWVVGSLGDPTGYLSGYDQNGLPAMHQVHQRFSDSLAKVEQRLADPKGGPILVLAHSLGGVVVTNYLWNLERVTGEVGTANAGATADGSRALARQAFGVTPAQKLETLAGLVTFGCNIPLFLPPTLPYECVRFPRRDLPEHLKAVARWLNVYDPFDVLGYPLNNLWDANFRHGTTIDDVPLAVGPFPISRTPLSHNYYWTDRGFQAMVAGQIRDVLRAARGSA